MKEQYDRTCEYLLSKLSKPTLEGLYSEQNCTFNIFHKKEQMAGWLFLTFTAGKKNIEIQTSEVFPPYQDLIFFLEDILQDILPKAIEIDEEGTSKYLFAYPAESRQSFYLVLADDELQILLVALCDRHKFAEHVFSEFNHFINGPYDAAAWTLGDDVDLKNISLKKLELLLAQ